MESKSCEAAVTLTFCEQSENHRGMQINGSGLASNGFSIDDLIAIQKRLLE